MADGAIKASWRQAVRGNVLMMGLVSLFTDFSSEIMNPLLPVFIAGLVPLGWEAFYVGLMEGVAETTASLLKLYSGRISDKMGRRKVLVTAGYGLSSVARPAMALAGLVSAATGGLQVVALKFLDRVGKGLRTSPRDALIGDSVPPERRGLAFSFHRAMDHAGAIIGPATAILLLYLLLGGDALSRSHGQKPTSDEMTSLRLLFALALLPGLAALAVLIGKVRDIAPRKDSAGSAENAGAWKALPGKFYLFVAAVGVFALGNSSDLFLLYYAWARFQVGLLPIMGLWILLHVSKMVFSLPGGMLSDRLGRRPMILAGWAVYAAVYLGMAWWVSGVWGFLAMFLLYGVYYGLTEGAEKALVTDFAGSEHRATAFGIYHAAVGVAALPASLMFGVFWKYIGPKFAFGIGAALAAAAAVMLIVLLSARRGKSPAPRAA